MVDKLNPKVVALSLTLTSVILSLVCAVFLALAPKAAMSFFGSTFHGIDIAKIAVPITLNGVLIGLVASVIIAYITGWLFAKVYNYLISKR